MNKRFVKRMITVMAVMAAMFGSVISVNAAEPKDAFEPGYYAQQNADIRAAFGDDEALLRNHFATYGLAEGRVFTPLFNAVIYRQMYDDLSAAFGDDWAAYANHYFTYGIAEGRSGGGVFDPLAYAAAYQDVQIVLGTDTAAIINHYLTYGIAEGRTAGISQSAQIPAATPETPAAGADDTDDGYYYEYEYGEDGVSLWESKFDSNGNELSSILYNDDGSIDLFFYWEYDENNRVIKQTEGEGNTIIEVCIYTYKADGSFASIVAYDGNGNEIRRHTF